MSGTPLPALPQPGMANATTPVGLAHVGPHQRGTTAPTVPPPILSSKPTIGGLWAAFRRRWLLATSLALLVGAIAATIAWFVTSPTSYTVSTTLRVRSTQPTIFFKTKEEQVDFRTYKDTQTSAVRKRLVLNSALRDPKVAQLAVVREQTDPLDWLTKDLQVDFNTGPETMRISMIGKDSEGIVILLDAIREAYLREEANKEHTLRLERLEKLTKWHDNYEDILRKKRKVLRDLAEPLGSKDNKTLAMKQQYALSELNGLQDELLRLQADLRRAELELPSKDELEKYLKEIVIPEAVIDEAVRKDPLVVDYQRVITGLEQYLAVYREQSVNPDKDPVYKQKQADLAAAQKLLATRRTELVPRITEELREKRRLESAQEQARQQERVDKMKRLDGLLAKQVHDREGQIQTIGKQTLDMGAQQEEIELVEQMSKSVGQEVQALGAEIDAPSRVTTEEPAYATKRDGLGIKAASAAGLGGLVVVLFGVTLLEFRARRLVDAEEVSHGLRLPVVGTMPRMRARDNHAASQGSNSRAAASQQLLIESVDAARAVIQHASKQHSLRVVMITSAVGGEGKTMLSAHLSASIARAGWRALLVDADFRRPSLQTVFGLPEEAGLSEVLRGEADIHEVMQPGPMDGLWVISAGTYDSRSMQALAQGTLRGIFDQIKEEFDLIIVDSAPVLPVVDSQLIAQAVDGVILSVLRDVSRLPLIHAAYERLTLFHASLLGVVVHGAAGGGYGAQYPYRPVPAAKASAPTNPE